MATSIVPIGYVDDGAYSGGYGELIDAVLEYVPDLLWPMSVRTYARMRWDPKLRAVLSAYTLPLRRATWSIDGAACDEAVTRDVANQLGLPILGQEPTPSAARRRGVNWSTHLRLQLLKLTFGHMAFEPIYDTSDGQKAQLIELPERMPQTIAEIEIDKQGKLVEITQNTIMGDPPKIKRKNLVWYTNDREGSAWTGQSLLRSAYGPWLIKHEMIRVLATSNRRFGMGVPEVTAPAGGTPVQTMEANRLAQAIRGGDTSGVGLPNGFVLNLRGITGSTPDTLGFIKYLDAQMTGATLTDLLGLPDSAHAGRAMGETFLDLLMLALQAIADDTAQQSTTEIAVPYVDANYGENEPVPRIVCADVGSDHDVTAETVQLLVSCGALEPDPSLDAFLRTQYKLPVRTTPWTGGNPPVSDPLTALPAEAQPPVDDQGAPIAAAARRVDGKEWETVLAAARRQAESLSA